MKSRTLVFLLAVIALVPCHAATVATIPSGYVTLTVSPGTGVATIPTVLSLPLRGISKAGGQTAGLLTGVGPTTISNVSAGWTPGTLSDAAAPSFVELTSGAGTGRVFLLSRTQANTETTATLDPTDNPGVDLVALGISAGDAYQIIPADTLAGTFGTPATTGICGNTSPTAADQILIYTAIGAKAYFFNTSTNHWMTAGLPRVNADNVVISPNGGFIYSRFPNTPLTFVICGTVPFVSRQVLVANTSTTGISNSWPVALTLKSMGIETIPGWVSASSAATADTVLVYDAVGGTQYYYNGTNWRRSGPPFTVGDSAAIPVGTMVMINKRGAASGQSTLAQKMPYSLSVAP